MSCPASFRKGVYVKPSSIQVHCVLSSPKIARCWRRSKRNIRTILSISRILVKIEMFFFTVNSVPVTTGILIARHNGNQWKHVLLDCEVHIHHVIASKRSLMFMGYVDLFCAFVFVLKFHMPFCNLQSFSCLSLQKFSELQSLLS